MSFLQNLKLSSNLSTFFYSLPVSFNISFNYEYPKDLINHMILIFVTQPSNSASVIADLSAAESEIFFQRYSIAMSVEQYPCSHPISIHKSFHYCFINFISITEFSEEIFTIYIPSKYVEISIEILLPAANLFCAKICFPSTS